MFDPAKLALFISAAFFLLIVPGPAVLYIVARSIEQGRVAGIVSTLGISLGTLVHVAGAAIGLSALLVSSALAFNTVKYLGAAYLIYLGIRTLTNREDAVLARKANSAKLSRIFRHGFLVNLLNPKTALFFFAFLPQFVDPARGSVTAQIAILGFILVVMGLLSDGTYAILAGSFAEWLKGKPRVMAARRYFSGGIYILLGLAAALSGSAKK